MKQNLSPPIFVPRNKLTGRSSYPGTPLWAPPAKKTITTPQESPSINIIEILANLSAEVLGITHSSPRSGRREECSHVQNQNLFP